MQTTPITATDVDSGRTFDVTDDIWADLDGAQITFRVSTDTHRAMLKYRLGKGFTHTYLLENLNQS